LIKEFPKNLILSFIDLVYPSLCLHCRDSLPKGWSHLCPECLAKLELIDHKERCPYCFTSNYNPGSELCPACRRLDPILHGMAAAFDYVGPAATLIRKLKYSDQPYLAKGVGAYLAAQFLELQWPWPDRIIPVPISLTHRLDRGYNQSLLLAQSMAEILDAPIQEPLIRKSGDFSQAGLNYKQRMNLKATTFILKKEQHLHDKCLLLIDDVMTTGSTLRRCAEALQEECPASIYGLTVCRAVKD